METYKKLDALDKNYKPLILKWLCSLFNYKGYTHSFRDQWINWLLWDGELSISFDPRVEAQNALLEVIPPRFLGVPQYRTLKVVNQKSFYLNIKSLIHIEYPDIVEYQMIDRCIHKENGEDDFYTYNWKLNLSDNTSIIYNNQKNKMDLVKRDYIYDSIIQERAFTEFLIQFKT